MPPYTGCRPSACPSGFRTRAALFLILAALPGTAPCLRGTEALLSSDGHPSIQAALDANPGRMVFVPAGDHEIDRAIVVRGDGAGLWGPGRIIQTNPEEPVVTVQDGRRQRVKGLTLTRPEGRRDTRQPALHLVRAVQMTVESVQVIDNWTDNAAIRAERCVQLVVRGCLVENYCRVTIEDWTKPAPNSGVCSGFAYVCLNGTGMNFVEVSGVLIQGNRIVENRLLPTRENQEKYGFGRFTKKNAEKGSHIDQKSWDTEYWYGWRQGAGIHVGSGRTSDTVQIIGNHLENMQQGIDLHCDHALVANNIINDASRGIKAMHGSRNIQIIANQFNRCDHFAIGLMQGAASHEAGRLPNKGPSPVGANIDGHSIIADNIISDFGYGLEGWVWQSDGRSGNPIQIGGKSPLADTPPLRNVIVRGSIVYDPGRDGILADGQVRPEPPRYKHAVRVVDGVPADNPGGQGGYANAPRNVWYLDNRFDPGTDGIANLELAPSAQ